MSFHVFSRCAQTQRIRDREEVAPQIYLGGDEARSGGETKSPLDIRYKGSPSRGGGEAHPTPRVGTEKNYSPVVHLVPDTALRLV